MSEIEMIVKKLESNPELLALMKAGADATPEILGAVVKYCKGGERLHKARDQTTNKNYTC